MAVDATPSKDSLAHMLEAEPVSEYEDGSLFVDFIWREVDTCLSIMWVSEVDN